MDKNKAKKIINKVVTATLAVIFVIVLVCLASVFVQLGQHKTPTLFGYRFFYVVTDSMTPYISPGDVIVGKKVTDAAALTEGKVVTYTATSGVLAGNLITHRIVKGVYYDENLSSYAIVTRGDKAGATDDAPVKVSDVNAVMVKKSAVISWILKAFRSGAGFALLLVLPLLFLLVCLVIRLVTVIKSPAEKNEAEGKELTAEEKIAIIKKRAVEEYIKNEALAEYEKNHSDEAARDEEKSSDKE